MQVVDGRQLKAARIILGFTMSEMAEASGLHKNSIYRVEKHHNLPVTAYAADKITQALKDRGIKFTIQGNALGIYFHGLPIRTKSKYVKKNVTE